MTWGHPGGEKWIVMAGLVPAIHALVSLSDA
jgi:hypothetical protein